MTWRLSRILFNTDMVRAILSGQKKVTRRVVKPQPFAVEQQKNAPCWCGHFVSENRNVIADKPPYRPGDILYVRETWCPHDTPNGRWYGDKADGDYRSSDYRWHPSICPRKLHGSSCG